MYLFGTLSLDTTGNRGRLRPRFGNLGVNYSFVFFFAWRQGTGDGLRSVNWC
jgi:hypothetical protein